MNIMLDFELKIHSRDIDTLISNILDNDDNADINIVQRAYDYAERAHKDQKRLSGEPYIIHPLEVAIILAKLGLDTNTISAALLHDVVEDTGNTLKDLAIEFSPDIAELVDGVTKISHIKNKSRASAQAETLRKMLIATVKDVRVIIIKLADKLHNMRTIMFQKEEKQERIAKETMDIYAPIARRLGMSKISSELEDHAFHILHPTEYKTIKTLLTQRKNELEDYIENVRIIIQQKINQLKINAEITGRAKHFFSIYRKMSSQGKELDEIYDIRAIRIITEEVKDCYGILGVVHTLWSPIAARFKDYIAVPKSNMYQSLHTTVIGPSGFPLEVQIRTYEMHTTAEMGIAAHWLYKDPDMKKNKKISKELPLLQNINWQTELDDNREFMKSLKMDLYESEIFVFTPKGKIIKLAKGATPVDFAYMIHTEIGHHTTGAKVNNKIVPLKTKLNSGDIVEIQTSKNGHPSEAWLKFVVSPNARYKIRSWIRKHDEALQKIKDENKAKEEKAKKEEQKITVTVPQNEQLKLKKLGTQKSSSVSINGTNNILIRLSQCCQPIPGDDVIGFITRGRGVTVHKKTCPSLKRLSIEKERIINIVWEESTNTYPVKINVHGTDRQNLLKDIADEIAQLKTNIIKAEAQVKDSENALFKFVLEVRSNNHLDTVINRLLQIKNITKVYKLNEKVIMK